MKQKNYVYSIQRKIEKKNNQVEYMLNDVETELFRITRCPIKPIDWCGDFVLRVTTEEELAEAKKEFGTD